MRAILPLLAAILLAPNLFTPSAVSAGELVMFESPICEYCEMWDDEVGIIYGKTSEAKLAALRRVDIYDERPADLKDLAPIIYTPTFVLMSDGREVGRILGYPGEANFWGLLGVLLAKIDPAAPVCPDGETLASTALDTERKSC